MDISRDLPCLALEIAKMENEAQINCPHHFLNGHIFSLGFGWRRCLLSTLGALAVASRVWQKGKEGKQ